MTHDRKEFSNTLGSASTLIIPILQDLPHPAQGLGVCGWDPEFKLDGSPIQIIENKRNSLYSQD